MSDDPSFAVPALVAAAASLDVPPAAAWNAPLCAPRADLRTLGEVLSAHALAAAGSFSELLSLGSLAGVFLGRQRAKAPVEGMQSLSDPAFHGALRELKPEKIKLHVEAEVAEAVAVAA